MSLKKEENISSFNLELKGVGGNLFENEKKHKKNKERKEKGNNSSLNTGFFKIREKDSIFSESSNENENDNELKNRININEKNNINDIKNETLNETQRNMNENYYDDLKEVHNDQQNYCFIHNKNFNNTDNLINLNNFDNNNYSNDKDFSNKNENINDNKFNNDLNKNTNEIIVNNFGKNNNCEYNNISRSMSSYSSKSSRRSFRERSRSNSVNYNRNNNDKKEEDINSNNRTSRNIINHGNKYRNNNESRFVIKNGCCRACMRAFSKNGKACLCQVPIRERKFQLPDKGCNYCGCKGCNPIDVRYNKRMAEKLFLIGDKNISYKNQRILNSDDEDLAIRENDVDNYNYDKKEIQHDLNEILKINSVFYGYGVPLRIPSYILGYNPKYSSHHSKTHSKSYDRKNKEKKNNFGINKNQRYKKNTY